ncbi:MAG: DivIVA domain-containing protein [Bacillota bacterium]
MLTPLDIHNKEFRKVLRGYDEAEVDEFLDRVVKDYEALYKEVGSLKDRLAVHEERVAQYQEMEETLKKTLVVAQETADHLKVNARREGELILREAEIKAGKIVDEAMERAREIIAENDEIRKQAMVFRSKLRSILQAQLELLDSQEWQPAPVNQKG